LRPVTVGRRVRAQKLMPPPIREAR
jgi:hypothetical protein